MRKIIILAFITLDGVMQAPGGTQEDISGGFKYGGWVVPYFDKPLGRVMEEQMNKGSDLLLGRKTFEIFAGYWPQHESDWPGINEVKKYVVSSKLQKHSWSNSVFLKNVAEVKKLKKGTGPDLQVYGSSNLIQTLLKNGLVDELWLKIFPIILGKGKRLFDKGIPSAAFKLTGSKTTPAGVIVANYKMAGKVKTGSFA